MRSIYLAAVAALAPMALSPPAAAAPAQEAQAVVQAVMACRDLSDGVARLACYDTAVTGLGKAQAPGGALDTVLKAPPAAVASSDIGKRAPKPAPPPAPPKNQAFAVTSAEIGTSGRLVVTLEGAGVWRQMADDGVVARWPRPGTKARLRKAIAGYFLTLDGQRAIRAERID